MTDWREAADAALNKPRVPLRTWSYPWWVIGLGAAVLAAFLYSLVSLPHHIALARELADAKRRDAARDYVGAEQEFAALLKDMPGSKPARLGMAHAVFADADTSNDQVGLALLADLQLNKDEWRNLSAVMPARYQEQFVEEQR